MPHAAVLGSPIAHSLSPVLHNAGYAALGLNDWTYGARRVEAHELAGVVASLDDSWRGLSLTMPLKAVAFDVAASISEVAREAGAINTLVRNGEQWVADNTDVHGLAAALTGIEHDGSALVIGAGATTRSALLALQSLGIEVITIAARRAEAVSDLARWAQSLRSGPLTIDAVPLDTWGAIHRRVIISTVPPAAAEAVVRQLQRVDLADDATLLDVVYADWPTGPARVAEQRGMRVISGLDMLVHQAAAQFEAFTHRPAPVAAMGAAGRAALRANDSDQAS